MASENPIEVRGLTKSFGDVLAVDDLTFDIPPGKVTGFLGPNGAGKSTTLRMILGLLRPQRGAALVLGKPFADLSAPARTVGALLEVDQFHPGRSGRNHLRVLATAAGIPAHRIDEVLETVELTAAAGRKVGGYSLGMKQRLGLAAALLGDPRILVLDEPANGLDPAGIRWLRNFLKTFASGGRAVFVSSHQLAQMAEMADDVVVVDKGRLVTHSPVDDLVGRASVTVRVVTPQPDRLGELLTERGIDHERMSADALRVAADGVVVGTLAAAESIPLFGLAEEQRALEDVFFELTGAHERSG
ncbi:MAG TPA: ATP-binding cassette domain-containing protein [Actinomycetota bacterium]|nr:ATP-binding cassette domain-containing protein [Actinomycetota bacterium]